MNLISNILYWISTGLLVPVIVLLIFFFIRAIILIGGFFGEYMSVKKLNAGLLTTIKGLTPEKLDSFKASLPEKPISVVGAYARKITEAGANRAAIDLLISEYELAAEKKLATSKMLTKMGPILGLMGTLIPMGPALAGLASGDISSMAYNMQIAFATTVVGLTVSATGFITQSVRERWYFRNVTVLEYLASIITDNKKAE